MAQPDTVGGYEQKLDSCIHRWAYRIAGMPGTITEIAHAALGGCDDALTFYASKRGEPKGADPSGYERERRNAERIYASKAAFYVATARAGDCPIPE